MTKPNLTHDVLRMRSDFIVRSNRSVPSRYLVQRGGWISLIGVTELLLIGCVVSGLLIVIAMMRPTVGSSTEEAEQSCSQSVPKLVVAKHCDEVWYQSGPSKLLRYDLEQRQCDLAYSAPDDSVISSWDVSDDGCTLLVSTLSQVTNSGYQLTIYHGEEIQVSEAFARSPQHPPYFDLSADGFRAIAISDGNQVQLWNLQQPEATVTEFSLEVSATMVRLDELHDQFLIVTHAGSVQFHDLCTQQLLKTIEVPNIDDGGRLKSINRIVVSADGELVAVGLVDAVAVFDLLHDEWIWRKRFVESHSVMELIFSADGRSIAASGLSAQLLVCDSHTGDCTHEFRSSSNTRSNEIHRIGFSGSNDRLFSASFGSTVFEWDLKTLQRITLNSVASRSIL